LQGTSHIGAGNIWLNGFILPGTAYPFWLTDELPAECTDAGFSQGIKIGLL
jgi:hypothetical protein